MKKVEKVNRNLRKRKISHVLHSDTYRIEKQYAQYNTNISTFLHILTMNISSAAIYARGK